MPTPNPIHLSPYFITTAIDYVNAEPHLGHAYEKVAADVLARFRRMWGDDVFFLTGTDEHGSKVQKTAFAKGLSPKAYTDAMSTQFKAAWEQLNLSPNRFIRTTDPDHALTVTQLWTQLANKGDIYKASYTGLYCTGCETFLNARELTEEGLCSIHHTKPEAVEEENYFFRLSHYKEAIKSHILSNPGFIQPEFRAQEVLRWLDDVEDISVSRSIASVSWGIPVPGDNSQRVYVWIDALSNYLAGVGYSQQPELFNRFWPAGVHIIGKDILRFHAIYWPALLMAAGLPLPHSIFAHGFITLNDSKISKSLGNVVHPMALAERFNLNSPDAIRYYLMTVAHFGNDGNFSEDDFKIKVNADLANNLGNLLNRTLTMCGKYCAFQVPIGASMVTPADAEAIVSAVATHYTHLAFLQGADVILGWADKANKLINDSEPWALAKQGDENSLTTLNNVMFTVLDMLRQVALMLAPITPQLSQAIWTQLGYTSPINQSTWQDIIKTPLVPGQLLQLGSPVFPRLDSDIVGAGKKRP
jgi:methionyl-tRNA synthetase